MSITGIYKPQLLSLQNRDNSTEISGEDLPSDGVTYWKFERRGRPQAWIPGEVLVGLFPSTSPRAPSRMRG